MGEGERKNGLRLAKNCGTLSPERGWLEGGVEKIPDSNKQKRVITRTISHQDVREALFYSGAQKRRELKTLGPR